MKNQIKLSPSILDADLTRLNEEIKEIEPYSDSIHLDIMDGIFVPNKSYGIEIVSKIETMLPLDCHLMVDDPLEHAKNFSNYVDRIFFHAELFEDKPSNLESTMNKIKNMDVEVGLTLNPDKPISLIKPYLDQLEGILIMSVYAGKGGQKFIPGVLDKVRELRKLNYKKDILIDGGINSTTIRQAVEAGANVIVAGSAIFGKKDRKKAIQILKEAIK